MKLTILTIGRMKAGAEKLLVERYVSRAEKTGKQLHLKGPLVREFAESRRTAAPGRKSEEAEILLGAMPGTCCLIALDEGGKDISSSEFANLMLSSRDEGIADLVFAIGGPDGHGKELLERANHRIALGSMTWPHQIARVLLTEQIYRATTILSGHPYHRD